jgi:ATP citrate (pro-S)-lyase
MSVKAIREHTGKSLLAKWLPELSGGKHAVGNPGVLISPDVLDKTSGQTWESILDANPWLKTEKLVAKPDQLIKRRGKAGLVAVNKSFDEAKQWVMDRMCKEQKIETVTGQLTHFIVEPMVAHQQSEEFYICIISLRYHDEILFYHEGGVDVGDVDSKAEKMEIPTGVEADAGTVTSKLLSKVPAAKQASLTSFVLALYIFTRSSTSRTSRSTPWSCSPTTASLRLIWPPRSTRRRTSLSPRSGARWTGLPRSVGLRTLRRRSSVTWMGRRVLR